MSEKSVTFTAPPNFTSAKCCGNCAHWQWGYEGEGDCTKYPEHVSTPTGYHDVWSGACSTGLCDDYALPSSPMEPT